MLIEEIIAREVLDSRGYPALEVEVFLEDGSHGRASVPSGASKGKKESLELRDEDPQRFNGKGLLKSIEFIKKEIRPILLDKDSFQQNYIDNLLIEIDGTPNKSRLGANTILAVSIAVAKAAAESASLPLFRYLGGVIGNILPNSLVNIINGGVHARNRLAIQEFMIIPVKNVNFVENMRFCSEIFHNLRNLLISANHNSNYGDEGGFAPDLENSEQAIGFIEKACNLSGYNLGEDVFLAIDAAASEFYKDGYYHLTCENKKFDTSQMIDFYQNLISKFPIISLEDPLAEDDSEGWKMITTALGSKTQLVGDDLFATNSKLLQMGIKENMANAILIKPNQIGTLSETIETINLAKRHNYNTIISHRSGETEDNMIAHLAVASNAGQIKSGSVCRTDRSAKYNELIRINEEIGNNTKIIGRSIYKGNQLL